MGHVLLRRSALLDAGACLASSAGPYTNPASSVARRTGVRRVDVRRGLRTRRLGWARQAPGSDAAQGEPPGGRARLRRDYPEPECPVLA